MKYCPKCKSKTSASKCPKCKVATVSRPDNESAESGEESFKLDLFGYLNEAKSEAQRRAIFASMRGFRKVHFNTSGSRAFVAGGKIGVDFPDKYKASQIHAALRKPGSQARTDLASVVKSARKKDPKVRTYSRESGASAQRSSSGARLSGFPAILAFIGRLRK